MPPAPKAANRTTISRPFPVSAPKLALYYFDSCPYCQKVLRAISELGLAVELRNTQQNPGHKKYLVERTGRATVPCLFIDDRPMHESGDIVDWLEENADNLEKDS